jgi:hypothetical protein
VDLSMLAWAFGNAGRNEGRDGDASGCLTEALARNALRLVEELGGDGELGRFWDLPSGKRSHI